MKTLQKQNNTKTEMIDTLKFRIELLRKENKELLKNLGEMESAETNSFSSTVSQIESNNLLIQRDLGAFHMLKNELLWG